MGQLATSDQSASALLRANRFEQSIAQTLFRLIQDRNLTAQEASSLQSSFGDERFFLDALFNALADTSILSKLISSDESALEVFLSEIVLDQRVNSRLSIKSFLISRFRWPVKAGEVYKTGDSDIIVSCSENRMSLNNDSEIHRRYTRYWSDILNGFYLLNLLCVIDNSRLFPKIYSTVQRLMISSTFEVNRDELFESIGHIASNFSEYWKSEKLRRRRIRDSKSIVSPDTRDYLRGTYGDKSDDIFHKFWGVVGVYYSIEEYIKDESEQSRVSFIKSLLSRSLTDVFQATNIIPIDQDALVEELAGRLLGGQTADALTKATMPHSPASPATAGGISTDKDVYADQPQVAPAMWAETKLPGDTPATFIRRHYGPWLRNDGTGLSRPDIKRLDPKLYMALANWLRNPANKLPDDCPLPTKSQTVDKWVQRVERDGRPSEMSHSEYSKFSQARSRRHTKQ